MIPVSETLKTSSPVLPAWRRYLPLFLVLLVGVAVAVIQFLPLEDFSQRHRFFKSVLAVGIGLVLLAGWVVFLSGLRWWQRVGLLVLGFVGLVLFWLTVHLDLDGDMVPVGFILRWRYLVPLALVLGAGVAVALIQFVPSKVFGRRERLFSSFLAVGLGLLLLVGWGVLLFGLPSHSGRSLAPGDLSEGPRDYPEYRNRLRDGVVNGPPLLRSLDNVRDPIWRHKVGGGYAGLAVAGNALITVEQRGGSEAIVCYDTRNGEEVWAFSYLAAFQETLGGDGPRATPTIKGDRVYSLGATGKLVCLQALDGKLLWKADILAGNKNVSWGMSGSPLVTETLVIVNPGKQKDSAAGRAVLAFDRLTGKEVWHAGDHQAGYCSPMRVQLAGQEQILIFDAQGLAGYDPQGQGELWRFKWETQDGINVAQPLIFPENQIFISSGYGHGCALVQVKRQGDQWSAEEKWSTKVMHSKFASPVAYQGHVYGLDEGILTCVDLATGKRAWPEKGRRYGHGQLLRQDDLLVILSEKGEIALVEAKPSGFRELGRIPALEGDKTWNCPALADGRLYVRNHEQLACFDLRAAK